MFYYWGFGLAIASEIEFPELFPAEFDKEDLIITVGTIPNEFKYISNTITTSGNHIFHLINDREFLFEVKHIAQYYAANGKCIIIELCANDVRMQSVRLFLLATVIAAILLQRKLLPFHASAIIRNGRLSLITGDSGAGKSTVTAGLIKRGYTIFSDDVVVLKKNRYGHILASASYPMIKLWDDTLIYLQNEMFNDRSFVIKAGIDKYGIFFHDSFNKKSYPVDNIIILKKGVIERIQTKQLLGGDAFIGVNEQIYRPRLLQGDQLKKISFNILTRLLKACRVYEITRPPGDSREKLLLHLEGLL